MIKAEYLFYYGIVLMVRRTQAHKILRRMAHAHMFMVNIHIFAKSFLPVPVLFQENRS